MSEMPMGAQNSELGADRVREDASAPTAWPQTWQNFAFTFNVAPQLLQNVAIVQHNH
jgi:hypothetical protein